MFSRMKKFFDDQKKAKKKAEEEDKKILAIYRKVAKDFKLTLKIESEHVGFYNPRKKRWGEVSFFYCTTRPCVVSELKSQRII